MRCDSESEENDLIHGYNDDMSVSGQAFIGVESLNSFLFSVKFLFIFFNVPISKMTSLFFCCCCGFFVQNLISIQLQFNFKPKIHPIFFLFQRCVLYFHIKRCCHLSSHLKTKTTMSIDSMRVSYDLASFHYMALLYCYVESKLKSIHGSSINCTCSVLSV